MVIYGNNCIVLGSFLVAAINTEASFARICLMLVSKKLSKLYSIFFPSRLKVLINKQTFILLVKSVLFFQYLSRYNSNSV